MLMDKMPIAVMMQRKTVNHMWANEVWTAVGIVQDKGDLPPVQQLNQIGPQEYYLVSGMQLELYPDENEGYFENWVAPEPKVFVMWRMQDCRAMPVIASVSYGEGARMLDSGESVDGVKMPWEIHCWLGEYLRKHYHPREHRGRQHG